MVRKLMWSAIPLIAIGTAAYASSAAPSQAVPLNGVRPVTAPATSAESFELASHRRGYRSGRRGYRSSYGGYRRGHRSYRRGYGSFRRGWSYRGGYGYFHVYRHHHGYVW